jgi:uncharacterized protein YndB with AHSA1/START domain
MLALAAPAGAEVVDSAPNGFALKYVNDISRPPAAVYRAIVDIARWWDASHSFSGQAANLSLDARAGGCFCERLPGGSVQHMVVIHADAPRTLILQGGPGPLASLGVAGAMEWKLTERNGGTHLEVTYNAGGYVTGGFAQLAPVVDGVFALQVRRLKTFAETGRPE